MDPHQLAQQLAARLSAAQMTISAAESCTGGLFLSTLTDLSGSSRYVQGGVVAYSNEAKQKLLGVQAATLAAHGAVSAETAEEMAIGVKRLFDTDVSISITGIAGPTGGTPEKPVGLVYIGMAFHNAIYSTRNIWQGNRVENKLYSVVAAIELVLSAAELPAVTS